MTRWRADLFRGVAIDWRESSAVLSEVNTKPGSPQSVVGIGVGDGRKVVRGWVVMEDAIRGYVVVIPRDGNPRLVDTVNIAREPVEGRTCCIGSGREANEDEQCNRERDDGMPIVSSDMQKLPPGPSYRLIKSFSAQSVILACGPSAVSFLSPCL